MENLILQMNSSERSISQMNIVDCSISPISSEESIMSLFPEISSVFGTTDPLQYELIHQYSEDASADRRGHKLICTEHMDGNIPTISLTDEESFSSPGSKILSAESKLFIDNCCVQTQVINCSVTLSSMGNIMKAFGIWLNSKGLMLESKNKRRTAVIHVGGALKAAGYTQREVTGTEHGKPNNVLSYWQLLVNGEHTKIVEVGSIDRRQNVIDFINERFIPAKELTALHDITTAYHEWAEHNRRSKIGTNSMARFLNKLGYKSRAISKSPRDNLPYTGWNFRIKGCTHKMYPDKFGVNR